MPDLLCCVNKRQRTKEVPCADLPGFFQAFDDPSVDIRNMVARVAMKLVINIQWGHAFSEMKFTFHEDLKHLAKERASCMVVSDIVEGFSMSPKNHNK